MRIVETADGSVRVYELDAAKGHVLFVDPDCAIDIGQISLKDGAINWVRRPSESVRIAEGEKPDAR